MTSRRPPHQPPPPDAEELVTKLYTEYLKDKSTLLILSVEDFSLVLLG